MSSPPGFAQLSAGHPAATNSASSSTHLPAGASTATGRVGAVARKISSLLPKGGFPLPTLPACIDTVESREQVLNEIKKQYLEGTNPRPNLNDYPELFQYPEVCRQWIESNAKTHRLSGVKLNLLLRNFHSLVPQARTEVMYVEIVNTCKEFSEHIPHESQTYAICYAALIQYFSEFPHHLHKDLITEKLLLDVCKKNALIIKILPERFQTEAFFLAAIQENHFAFSLISQNLQTPVLCECAVKIDGIQLGDVRSGLITKDLCLLAVQKNGLALQYVPKEFCSQHLIDTALKQNSQAIEFVPEEFASLEIWKARVQQDSYKIFEVPKELLTEELVVLAVSGSQSVFGKLLEHKSTKPFLTEAVYLVALQNSIANMRIMPVDRITVNLAVKAYLGFKTRNERGQFWYELQTNAKNWTVNDWKNFEDSIEAALS